ncbi:MAG: hypothetical protein V2A58_15790 [Planctomycetota bacterium]
MSPRLVALCLLTVLLAALGCSKELPPSAVPAANTTVPELDLSEVTKYVALDKADVSTDASGTEAQLTIVLKVLADFEGKLLVLDTYDSKTAEQGAFIARSRVPQPQDGRITMTIAPIYMWQQQGKGIFRLVASSP